MPFMFSIILPVNIQQCYDFRFGTKEYVWSYSLKLWLSHEALMRAGGESWLNNVVED